MAPRPRLALGTRVSLVLTVIVAVAMALSATICFVAMRSSLRGEVDSVLRDSAQAMNRVPPTRIDPKQLQAGMDALGRSSDSASDTTSVFQLIAGDRRTTITPTGVRGFVVTAGDRALAARPRGTSALDDRTVDGQHFRVITIAVGNPSISALQIGRSLTSVDRDLHELAWTLALLGFAGTALAAGAAWVLTRPVVAPTEEALAGSLAAQRQLVADASHELRTPITSLRTNAELLTHHATLDPATRDQIAAELVQQTEGLASLVTDLLDLAKDPDAVTLVPTRLDEIVLEAVADAQRAHPDATITDRVAPCLVKGSRPELQRVLRNLIDNAVIHGVPAEGATRVQVELSTSGTVTVRDWGLGIPRSELPRLFDRFARGERSRGLPGSGLGLAIVHQIVEAHHGSVSLHAPESGPGTVADVRLPTMANVAHHAATA